MVKPLVRIARDAASEAMKFAADFGLTPASRFRLHGTGQPQPSKFGNLIR